MMIYTEMTPNPASLKFVTEQVLIPKGSVDYPDPANAEESPLAQKLFEFAFVQGVFLGHNFVTVTKSPETKWEDLIPPLKETLKAFLQSGQKIIHREFEAPAPEEEDDAVVAKIKKLLEDNIRPAVAMDGGDVSFESFEDGKVKLRLQGSCSGCPSSTMTLKMGIQGLLTRMVPEVKEVEAVNG